MAGVIANTNSGEVTLVASTAKTLLQIKAATNQRVVIKSIRLMGKQPAGGSDTPIKIRLTRSTSSFGAGAAATLAKNNPSDAETLQTTCYAGLTTEPASPADGGIIWEVQPQSGVIEFITPDLFIPVPGGAAANFEATSPATPVVTCTVQFVE